MSLRQKKFCLLSADFRGAQVDRIEWMSDFFVVRIKRIRNDERLIFDGVETFSFALKKDAREYHAHTKNALSLELFCVLSVRE